MNAKQENRLTMCLVLLKFLESVPLSIISQMPGFADLLLLFKRNVGDLRILKQGQRLNRKGFKVAKINYKDLMIDVSLNMSSRVRAYALAIGDMVLWNEMDFKRYKFDKMRDSDVADDCQTIYDKAKGLLAEVGLYGVTVENLAELQMGIDEYNLYLPMPRAGIISRKTITEEIRNLFVVNELTLEKMDSLSLMLEFTEKLYFMEYFDTRKVVSTGGRVIALRGKVTDKAGVVLQRVLVRVGGVYGYSTYSTAKGYYSFKNLLSGVYKVVFSREGYADYAAEVAITDTLRTEFDVALVVKEASGKTG
jgi:hypothetical protein